MLDRRLLLLASPALLAGCAVIPDPTGEADVDMLGLLRSFTTLGARPIERLTPEVARRQPSMADAVVKRLNDLGRPFAPRDVERGSLTIPTAAGPLPARLYRPRRPAQALAGGLDEGEQPLLPLVLYFHGGGFVIADLDTYDSSARAIAAESGAAVLSIRYRQAPEHPFPAAHEDAEAAWLWAADNAESLGADPRRMAVVGESAGGNLAAHVGIAARDKSLHQPAMMGLIYPVAGTDSETPSYQRYARAKPLNKAMMAWFLENAIADQSQLADPRLNLYAASDLRALPPTLIVNAQIDPLADDGARLEGAIKRAGSPVQRVVYPGTTHEFFGADAVLPSAAAAQRVMGQGLRTTFARVQPRPDPEMQPWERARRGLRVR